MAGETRISLARRLVRIFRDGPPPLLFVALLCGLAIQPYLSSQFPSSADGKLHLYRLIEFDHAIRNGYFFPRWSPDLAYGYGFPLFNYYAPLPYYLGSLLHLFGPSYQLATQATFVVLVILAGWATYRWVTHLFGRAAGLVAGAAYLYMPYMGHLTVHRGALGEVAGLAFMPLILWAFTLLAENVTRWRFVFAALSLAGLLLAHNLTSLLFAPILLVALLILWWAGDRIPRRALSLLGAAGMGLALSTIFWLPALAERHMVQIDRVFGPAAFDFRLHFLTLRQLLTPPPPFDPRQLRQPFPPALGLPQAALALVTAWSLARAGWSLRQRALVGAALVGALLLLALMLPVSLPLWESFEILRFVQFPWRLLGPAGLMLALLGGAGVASLPLETTHRWHPLAASAAVLVMALFGLWWLFGDYEPPLSARVVQDIHRFEIENNAVGTTSFADYLPTTVSELPPSDGLAARYAEADVIPRLSSDGLPEGGEVLSQRFGVNRASARVDSPQPFTATWDWFAFPGWEATVDGQPVPITPSAPHGLIQHEVPAGRHRMTIRFRLTPVRLASRLTSLFALIALAGIAYRLPVAASPHRPQLRIAWREAWPAVGLLTLFVLKVAFLNNNESFYRRSRYDGQTLSGIVAPARVRFADQMVYLGHDIDAEPIVAGQNLAVTLYWGSQGPLDADYSTSATLRDASGNIIAQADSQHPADLPTSRWKPFEFAADTHRLTIPPDTPPGTYDLQTAVYQVVGDGAVPLAVLDNAGNPAGTTLPVTQISVERPPAPPNPAAIPAETRLEARLTPNIELVGYDLPSHAFIPGESLPLEIIWHAPQAPTDDLTMTFALHTPDGHPVATQDGPLVSGSYPTTNWPDGEVVRGRHRLDLPRDLPGGTYVLIVSIGDDAVTLGEVRITQTPPPILDLPQTATTVTLDWQDGVTLLGYHLPLTELSPGDPLALTLFWHAGGEPKASYKVFIHVLDGQGNIRAQSDRVPADWARPTTSWRQGEIIPDSYQLPLDALPAGTYTLRVGLYDADTLVRLSTASDDLTAIDLTEIQLVAP